MAYKQFGYSGFKSRGGAYSMRPQILTTLYGTAKPQELSALVDSGSEHTIINAEWASILGVDLSKCQETDMNGVIDSTVKGKIATIRMEFDGFPEEFKFKVRFVENMALDMILGQHDFFEEFRVRFERKRQKFYLERN